MESKKYEGYWWLPNNPNKKVTGNLSINQREGLELRIISSLHQKYSLFDKEAFPEIILGQEIDGNLITLIKPICTNSKSNFSNFSVDLSACTYRAQFAIIGKRHFNTIKDIVFTSAEVRFSLLDEWLAQSGFRDNQEINDQGYLVKYDLKYEYPQIIEFNINSFNFKIKTNYFFNHHHKYLYLQHELCHKSFFKIEPDRPQNIYWYNDIFENLRRFITVITGFPVRITDIIAYGNDYYINEDIKNKEKFIIFYQLPKNFIETKDKHPGKLLTCLNKLESELSTILNNWFKKSEVLKPVIILYVATLSTDLGYSEFYFLNYTQALEALHRRLFGGKYLTNEEYKPVYQKLLNSIPESLERGHRDSLKGRIQYGNEFSQRKRIKLLLDEVWEGCLDEFINNKNIFIDQVINTRNYLIHYNSETESQAVQGKEIFYLTERLKIILIAHILLQLGIPKKNIYRDIKKFADFEYLKL